MSERSKSNTDPKEPEIVAVTRKARTELLAKVAVSRMELERSMQDDLDKIAANEQSLRAYGVPFGGRPPRMLFLQPVDAAILLLMEAGGDVSMPEDDLIDMMLKEGVSMANEQPRGSITRAFGRDSVKDNRLTFADTKVSINKTYFQEKIRDADLAQKDRKAKKDIK